MNTKPLPKSLHTVTVLVAVAELVKEYYDHDILTDEDRLSWDDALHETVALLGLKDRPDDYNLIGAALRQLEACA